MEEKGCFEPPLDRSHTEVAWFYVRAFHTQTPAGGSRVPECCRGGSGPGGAPRAAGTPWEAECLTGGR